MATNYPLHSDHVGISYLCLQCYSSYQETSLREQIGGARREADTLEVNDEQILAIKTAIKRWSK